MDLKQYTEKVSSQALDDLKKWIQIPSVFDGTTIQEGAPFGKEVKNALQYIAHLAKQKGFEVDECDGYATEIKWGKGPKLISVYAHTDVVPVSGNWTYPPFSGEIADGQMFGRGTSDDKGPAMAAFYAFQYVREHLDPEKVQIRLVIGGNEESGSQCLKYYFHTLHKPYPLYGFTPDGDFPLIYGEKGIAGYRCKKNVDLPHLFSLDAGVVVNSVPDLATAILKDDADFVSYVKTLNISSEFIFQEDKMIWKVYGKAAHGSIPEQGDNAGLKMLQILGEYYHIPEFLEICKQYRDPFGKAMGQYYETELLHQTTYNVGLIHYENGVLSYQVNFRYPESVDASKVVEAIAKQSTFDVELLSDSKPLLMDPNSPMVQTLWKVYQNVTGDHQTPIMTIGGGTYAKECKNTLAFGSAFPGRTDHIHDVDESIHLDDFLLSISIYAEALMELANL